MSQNAAQGSLLKGVVSDNPNPVNDGVLSPISLTTQGRVRVSMVESDINKVWNETFNNPWFQDNAWEMESLYV